ncbi:hypothetical protein LTR36_010240 [Oleoguttula mirabilis]|uniref:Mid2 domain-containing protein n=1 Tax=Oleoguttula mirabilis TaxID=1507867 RepID=A0AAV9JUX1_9PEZI|nr:hypothetical protein LTR36_010240 [Oleoguttula mirabilis]
MAPLLLKTLSTVLVAFAVLHVHRVAANCYYPNGDLSISDDACSSNGGACCPEQWECLSNGLCYNGKDDFYGRYTCTDETWQSGSCPQICTQGNTATGDEAMLQCADGSWCCDGNRSFNCCTTADTSFLSLPQGNFVASILSIPSPSSVASTASSNLPASTSDATPTTPSSSAQAQTTSSSSTSAVSSTSTTSANSQTSPSTLSTASAGSPTSQQRSTTPATSTITSASMTTASDGVVSTVFVVSVQSAAPSATSTNHAPDPSSHLGLVIGLAVGIPIFLLACAIIAFILWRRRKATRGQPYLSPPRNSDEDRDMTDKYGHQVGHLAPDGRAPELDSYPVALGRTKSGRHSELEGSGLLHSPATSTGTAPPQYTQQSPRSPGLHSVQEEPQEPHELWGGYVPYRPPRGELPSEREAADNGAQH